MKKVWLLMIPILIIGIIQAQKIDAQNDTRTTPRTIVNEADIPVRLHTNRKSIMTNDLEAGTQDIKVEQMTKVKMDQGGLRKKELVDEAQTVAPQIPFEPLHPHRLTNIEPYPEAENIDVLPKPIGKTWRKPKENLYIKGEMLIQLKNDARARVNIEVKDGTATFGIPDLDILNVRYSVNDISRVLDELPHKAKDFGLDLIFLMKVPVDLDLELVSEEYRKLEDVKEVSPNYIPFKLDADAPPRTIPNDPLYDWSDSIVKGPECWAIPETGDNSIIISILDIERLYETHADLNGNYLGMKSGIVGTGDHGTMCISVACAELNNVIATGMSGLCGGWSGTQGVLWTGYVFTTAADNITGITWSVNTAGARVLTESIGFFGNPAGLESAFEWAWGMGVISFASAGNDAANPEPGWPAYYGVVMAVGGCDAQGKLWDWGTGTGSNIGEWVDILGPGDAQYCCDATGYTNSYGGTSFATPGAAAAAALMLSDSPSLTPAQIRDRLIRAADYNEHKSPEYAGLMGAGIVNLYESVESYNVNVSVNEMLDVPAAPPAYASIIPRAVVQNRGTGLASFDVIAEADQLGIVYADTVHVTDLAPNTEYQQNAVLCQFKKWIPPSGIYAFRIYTNLSGDLNTGNDTLRQSVNVQSAGAATIDTLIYDQDNYVYYWSDANYYWAVRCSPAQPCSVISIYFYGRGTGNYSIYTWNDASGTPGSVATGPQTYNNTSDGWKTVDITGHQYFAGDFHIGYQCPGGDPGPGPWNTSDDGPGSGRSEYSANGSSWNTYAARNWQIRAIVKYPGAATHDVTLNSILTPVPHEITAMPVIPQVIVKNFGSSAETGFDVTMKIDSAGTEIYTSTETIAMNMGKYDVDTVIFDGWMPNYEAGTYNCRCYTQLGTDEDRSNDTAYVDVLCTDTDTLLFDDGAAAFYSGDSIYAGVRFTLNSPANILGAEYFIWKVRDAAPAPSVVPCTVFVWDDAGGNPGTQLGQDTIMPPNTVGNQTYWHNWTLGSPIAHSGDFWCGIWQPGMVGTVGADSTREYILFDAASESYRTKTSDDKSTWNTRTIDGMIRVIVQYSGTVNDHDVMTKEINEPGTIVSTLYDYPIKADVKNIGANTETFNVVARVTESEGPQVYQQAQNVSNLNPGEITSITFPDWQPAKAYDYYNLEVYTTLGSDVNLNNDTIIQDSIFSTPNEIIWYDNGVATWFWGDPDYRYTAQRFTPEAAGWCIGCWVAMQSDVTPWTDCTLFVWDDDDGWNDGGLPDPSALRLFSPVGFDPGGTGGYWFYISFSPIRVDTFSDFFIGVWNAEPPHILMDDTTSVWRAFCAEDRTSDDWQPISYDLLLQAVMRYDKGVPPKPAYIYAQKNTAKDSIILYWESVTQDTLDDPTAIDWYEIYSNADPSYVPVGADWLDSPSDTFYMEEIPPENRHYLNYPVSVYLQVADKSNMGYALQKAVNENAGATGDRNWVSMPWHSEYSRVIDLTDDLSPSGTPLSKITKLADDQTYENWIHHPVLGWYGDTFDIEPGCAYEMIAVTDATILLVGSNNPTGEVALNENAGAVGDRNWVSVPYSAAYNRVIDITNEYSSGGEAVTKITNLRNDQIFENWIYHPVLGWYGDTFDIEPGRAYEMIAVTDTTWNPTEFSNKTFMQMAARRKKHTELKVKLGRLSKPDRSPVWAVEEKGYLPTFAKAKQLCRQAGISHVVRAEIEMPDCGQVVFTAYRLNQPYDVLTENIIGCGTAAKNDLHVLWFDAGNFMRPWEHCEEVMLIVEALKQGKGYFTVLSFKLDKAVDIQELGELALMPIPEPSAGKGTVSWNMIDNDHVIGYSVYQGDRRMNEQVITANKFSASDNATLKPVIKGGYETVFGSHGSRLSITPISYAFSIYPNPFAKQTRVDYAIPKPTSVEVKIYDVTGKLVKTLMNKKLEPGYYQIDWYGKDNIGRKVAAGVYFIRMNAQGFESQQKVIFIR
ncbi:MAG: S8 family serine peptidase [bacterium]